MINSFRIYIRWVPAILCFFALQNVVGQVNLPDTLVLDPKIKVGKLENGLTYYIRQNKKPEQKVELRLVVNAGSINEDDDQQQAADARGAVAHLVVAPARKPADDEQDQQDQQYETHEPYLRRARSAARA